MLAATLNSPKSEVEWEQWSLANADAVAQIRQAILAQKGVTLPAYAIQPIPFNDIDSWLNNIQQGQNDFTAVLRQPAFDLTGVDLKDDNQRDAWIWLNYKAMSAACEALGIGP